MSYLNPTKKLVIASLLVALSFAGMMFQVSYPINPNLRFDLSEIFCLLGGIVLGPWVGLLIVAIKSLMHMILIQWEPIGHTMNVLAVGSMVVVTSLIFSSFRANKKRWGWLVLALLVGIIVRTLIMIPTNLLVIRLWWGLYFPDMNAALFFVYIAAPSFNLIQGIASGIIAMPLLKAFETYILQQGEKT